MAGTATEPLVGRTAIELAAAVREGRASPQDVVEAHLEWIESLDRSIHAFQVVRPDGVREEARALASRADLRELPLAGVPVAIKDNLEMAGYATRSGTLASPDEPAASDDELVRRLRRAGAIPLGKTTVPELCLWPFTETAAFGATRNPWNLDHTPGGSSGGGGAAVAAAMAALALGSDGGGSIRIPASCCGLVGMKPGSDVVPAAAGHSTWVGMSEYGPLGTTVADVALMLDVLAGTQTYRAVAPPSGSLRIAASSASPAIGVKVHPEVERAFQATAEALRSSGHAVIPADPPYRPTDSLPSPPLRIGAYQGKGLWPTILGLTRFMPYPPLQNLLGFPAISVPAGRSSEGLPIGVQLVAPKGTEALLLSVALQLETAQPWPRHASLEGVQRS